MTWLINIFLVWLARTSLFVLSPLLFTGSLIITLIKYISILIKVTTTGSPIADNQRPVAKYFIRLAETLDRLGNVRGGPVFNLIMFKWSARPVIVFGSPHDTLSFVYGMNAKVIRKSFSILRWRINYFIVQSETLNWFGIFWCYICELADRDHLFKSTQPQFNKYELLTK